MTQCEIDFDKKLTQKERLLEMFRVNDNKLRLGQILQTTLAAAYRSRLTDLRQDGFIIICTRGKTPSENTYVLAE